MEALFEIPLEDPFSLPPLILIPETDRFPCTYTKPRLFLGLFFLGPL